MYCPYPVTSILKVALWAKKATGNPAIASPFQKRGKRRARSKEKTYPVELVFFKELSRKLHSKVFTYISLVVKESRRSRLLAEHTSTLNKIRVLFMVNR